MDNPVMESPLEVLSRAATMVQSGVAKGDSGLGKDVQPSARWRRERRPCPLGRSAAAAARGGEEDDGAVPLDMSTRGRRSGAPPASDDRHGGGSESDPVIDEHFRRSLGQDYLALFPHSSGSGNGQAKPRTDKPPSPKKMMPFDPSDDASFTPLTVDDHFAKALGDTWHRLQASKKDNEDKTPSSSSSSSTPPASPSVVTAAV